MSGKLKPGLEGERTQKTQNRLRRPLEQASSIGCSIYRAKPLLVVRRERSAATSYKVTRTWLSSLVAGRGTISGIACTVRVCEHRHGHSQHQRCHNQSYR